MRGWHCGIAQAPVQVPATACPMQLPDNAPGMATKDGPSGLAPVFMWETQAKLLHPGFGLAHCSHLGFRE